MRSYVSPDSNGSEQLPIEPPRYHLRVRWSVSLSVGEAVWAHSTLGGTRGRLFGADIAQESHDATVEPLHLRLRPFPELARLPVGRGASAGCVHMRVGAVEARRPAELPGLSPSQDCQLRRVAGHRVQKDLYK